jgi:hypothetical protein
MKSTSPRLLLRLASVLVLSAASGGIVAARADDGDAGRIVVAAGQPPPDLVVRIGLADPFASPGFTEPLDWYWVIVYNGTRVWVTPSGLSTTQAPLTTAPPGPLSDVTLLNVTLPRPVRR